METFFELDVQDVIRETNDAVTLVLQADKNIASQFQFQPGQYVTLRIPIEGKVYRRAYSLSTSPLDKQLSITVKEIQGGSVSPYLCNHITKGTKLEALPPMGDFTYHAATEKGKSYYMFAGGSGITPIFSNLKTILQTEPQSLVHVLFGNKNEESIIFRDELAKLAEQYPKQLHIQYALEEVEKKNWFSSLLVEEDAKVAIEIQEGRADASMTNLFLDRHRPQHRQVEYFICGPSQMMENIEKVLLNRGINPENIRLERFTDENQQIIAKDAKIVSTLTAHLKGETITVSMREGETILAALIEKGMDPPYSCRTGSCATCIGKCTSGRVKMNANATLEDEDVAKGLVLTCQAVPLTEAVEIYY